MCIRTWCSEPAHPSFVLLVYRMRKRKKRFENSNNFQQTIKAGLESRWHLPSMRILDRIHPKTNTSKHYLWPKLHEKIKKTEINKLKNESNKTRPKPTKLYFIRSSLDKIYDLSIIRLGDRPTKKAKRAKFKKTILSFWKQLISNWLKRNHFISPWLIRKANLYVKQLKPGVVRNMLDDCKTNSANWANPLVW